jgi:hypothetical protein
MKVKEYIRDTGDPKCKSHIELYAFGVAKGFFWYEAMMSAVDPAARRLYCPAAEL